MFSWLKKYFIPHDKNNYKPHFLRRESTILVLFLIIVIELSFLVQVFIVFDKTSFLASVLPGVLTTMTNEERAQNDAAPLKENALLDRAAQLKANDMATHGYFAHTSPEGKTPWYWFDQVGYNYSMAGENLAVNFFESQDVAQAWMNSPTHRENIVKKDYTEIGIAVANGVYEGRNTVFVAQLFGTPAIEQTTAVIPISSTTAPTIKPKTSVKIQPKISKPVTQKTTVTISPTAIKVLGEETNTAKPIAQEQSSYSFIKSFVQRILTSPVEYVNYVYGSILLIVMMALAFAIFIKKEFQHPSLIARGVAIVAVIIVLLFVNLKVLHLDTKVPSDGLGASVIAY